MASVGVLQNAGISESGLEGGAKVSDLAVKDQADGGGLGIITQSTGARRQVHETHGQTATPQISTGT